MMKRLPHLAIAIVVLVLGSVLYTRWYDGQRSAWEQRAETEAERARTWRAEHQRTLEFIDSLYEAGRAQAAHADSIAHAARAGQGRIRTRIVVVRDSAPPDPARDSIIDHLLLESEQYRVAYETSDAAYRTLLGVATSLRAELQVAAARIDSLVAVIEDRPGERAWYVPKLVVGYGGCVCGGTLQTGPSATLGLEIRF